MLRFFDHLLRAIAGGNTGGYEEQPREADQFTAISHAIWK